MYSKKVFYFNMISQSIFCRIPVLSRNQCCSAGRNYYKLYWNNSQKNSRTDFKFLHVTAVDYKMRGKLREKLEMELQMKKKMIKPVEVWIGMSVKEISEIFKCDTEAIQIILRNVSPNDSLSQKDILLLSKSLKKRCLFIKNPSLLENVEKKQSPCIKPSSRPENLIKRPPVVTIMGHVDHGKTTLLDSLRNTFVVENEFGGITQHIGAFSVQVKSGQNITFIDTPGHAAFTTMRARGALVTDIIVLVIAADDGIMEQTVESIKIANRAQVKMIVAVNKIDKPQSMSIEVIKEKLINEGIQVEDKGGDVQIVPISALKKINLDVLVDMILLEADVMNLRADPTALVEGVIIESKKGILGSTATMIVKQGTLQKGKILVGGNCYAKVRAMLDENGKPYTEVLPSFPVQVVGWKDLPDSGDAVLEVSSEKEAARIVKRRKQMETLKKQKEDNIVIQEKARLHQIQHLEDTHNYNSLKTLSEKKKYILMKRELEHKKNPENNTPHIKLIIKADVQGSLEVLLEILGTYNVHDQCKMSIVSASVGQVTENDIEMSKTLNAIIYTFNIELSDNIKQLMREKNIDIHSHNVIYKLIDDLKAVITSVLPLKPIEVIKGEASVLQNFYINQKNKKIPVAGCKCTKGELLKDSNFKIMRVNEIIFDGKVISMRHHKNEVKVIKKDVECGLMFDSTTTEFNPLDTIICYEIQEVPQTTSWDPGF